MSDDICSRCGSSSCTGTCDPANDRLEDSNLSTKEKLDKVAAELLEAKDELVKSARTNGMLRELNTLSEYIIAARAGILSGRAFQPDDNPNENKNKTSPQEIFIHCDQTTYDFVRVYINKRVRELTAQD
jgi:hypothetical protein